LSTGKYLVYATIISTFVLIVWGAYLTALGAGGACGTGSASAISNDWPFCNGSFAIPVNNWGALVEYIHRTLSVVTGILLLAATVVVWRMKPRPMASARALLLAFIILIIQILLGNVVVNSNLDAVVTALHLATATALFGVIVVAGVMMYTWEKRDH
jgi:cytochrome c oxidase assembly protein subunit 15